MVSHEELLNRVLQGSGALKPILEPTQLDLELAIAEDTLAIVEGRFDQLGFRYSSE